jgi:hypothetical protein
MKSLHATGLVTLAVIIAITMNLVGCSTVVPTDTPGVDRLGEYILRQNLPDAITVLGYRYAANNHGIDWLILELAVSSPNGQRATIKRDDVFVRSPDGTKIRLASQKAFGEAYGSLAGNLRQADIVRDPLGYFPASRQECQLRFFSAPGEAVVFEEVTVDDRRVCSGRLFFYVPGGVQPGRWTLNIDLEETTIRIPFQL